ncbi:hypothetical protein K469DRAFT_594129, partial [Zopfia rhizophila CBS 207.26]
YFYPHYIKLRTYFWDTFYKEISQISAQNQYLIKVTRLFRLFRTYSFKERDARIMYFKILYIL